MTLGKPHYFPYGKEEMDYLCSRDERLAEAIRAIGVIKREVVPDPFTALISSIVSQQISSKAAQTVWQRLVTLLGSVTLDSISQVESKEIQRCGMSYRKVGYIKGIAQAAITGQIDFAALCDLPDEEVIRVLSSLNKLTFPLSYSRYRSISL